MALTPEQIVLYTGRLTAAESAMHDMLTGQQVKTFVDQSGERIEYQLMSRDALRGYIFDLKVLLGLPTGASGPLRPWML